MWDRIASGMLPTMMQPIFTAPECLRQFDTINVEDATHAIHNLPAKTSSLDYISVGILQNCDAMFDPSIARLANLSFSWGMVSAHVQVSHFLNKPGEYTTDMSNICKITNLNTIDKILDHLAMKQFWSTAAGLQIWDIFSWHTRLYTPLSMTLDQVIF